MEESPIHIFTECAALDNERIRIFGSPDPEISNEWEKILEFVFVDTIQDLIAFKKNSNVNSTVYAQ